MRSGKVLWRKTCVECDSSHGQAWSMWSVFVDNAMSYCDMGVLPSFFRFFRWRWEVNLLKRGVEIPKLWVCKKPDLETVFPIHKL